MTDDSTTTSMFTPNKQLKELSRQVLAIRSQLRDNRNNISQEILSRLTHLAAHLDNISKQVERHEAERKDLRALADIGRIVNSSLELNDVLRIVMDTIIRLTGAERGFLAVFVEREVRLDELVPLDAHHGDGKRRPTVGLVRAQHAVGDVLQRLKGHPLGRGLAPAHVQVVEPHAQQAQQHGDGQGRPEYDHWA